MKSLKLFCGPNQLLILTGILDAAGISHRIAEPHYVLAPLPPPFLLQIEEGDDYERARDLLNEFLGEGNWSS
jgi:hypothetical protein